MRWWVSETLGWQEERIYKHHLHSPGLLHPTRMGCLSVPSLVVDTRGGGGIKIFARASLSSNPGRLANGTLSVSPLARLLSNGMQCPSQSRQGLQESSLIFFYLATPCTRGGPRACMDWTDTNCNCNWYCEPGEEPRASEECISNSARTLCAMQCSVHVCHDHHCSVCAVCLVMFRSPVMRASKSLSWTASLSKQQD